MESIVIRILIRVKQREEDDNYFKLVHMGG